MDGSSDTPKTDAFIERHPLRLPMTVATEVETVIQVREFITAWAKFARELEREMNMSVPAEWLDEPPHRRQQ